MPGRSRTDQRPEAGQARAPNDVMRSAGTRRIAVWRLLDSATDPRVVAARLTDRRRFYGGGTRESPRSGVLQLFKCATCQNPTDSPQGHPSGGLQPPRTPGGVECQLEPVTEPLELWL